jgi:hypothetical protein
VAATRLFCAVQRAVSVSGELVAQLTPSVQVKFAGTSPKSLWNTTSMYPLVGVVVPVVNTMVWVDVSPTSELLRVSLASVMESIAPAIFGKGTNPYMATKHIVSMNTIHFLFLFAFIIF